MNEEITEATESPAPLNKKSATKAFAWSVVVATVVKLGLPFISIFFITRVLGPDQLGIYYIVSMIVQFSEVIRDAGLTQTYMADPEMNPKKEGSFHFVSVFTGLIQTLVLIAIAPWMAQIFGLPELRYALPLISAISLINGFSSIPRAKMMRAGQIVYATTTDLVGAVLGLTTAVIMVSSGSNFVALVFQMLVSASFSLIVNTVKYPVKSFNANIQAFRDVGRRAAAVLAANGLNNLFLFSDQAVIGKFIGSLGSGYFGMAANLAYKPADLMVFPLTRTIMVAFSQSAVDHVRLARIYARALSVAILFVLPMYVVMALFAEPIIVTLVTSKWLGSVPVLVSMCIYLSFRVFGNISGYALVPAGKHYLTFYPWLGCLAITGTALYFVIPQKQLMPIVWSFTAGAVFVYGTLTILGLIHCKPAPADMGRIKKALAATALFAAFATAISFLPMPGLPKLILVLVLGPVLHLLGIGTIFARKAFEYLSLSGVKRLYHEF